MENVLWRRFRRTRSDMLRLRYARRTVGVEAVRWLPSVMVLAVEDACTRFAYEDWRRRQPSRRRIWARRRWLEEGAFLREKSARLRELARECLDSAE
ncbi:hypothetical protein ACOKM5_39480 [Streptomyces sp. BH097]|uniref:hypothetical protein n=1 Tax=unclassified Streptomyces TaxID=2593676 RepID=UPI003BB5F933